jgi:hypothetical protein
VCEREREREREGERIAEYRTRTVRSESGSDRERQIEGGGEGGREGGHVCEGMRGSERSSVVRKEGVLLGRGERLSVVREGSVCVC